MSNPGAIDWLLYERSAIEEGYDIVCGVDEAGRGPLAGPVFAAAVILPHDTVFENINDSKKLTAKKREALFDIIRDGAVSYSICARDERTIDSVNILNATLDAMRECVCELEPAPKLAMIDGNRLPPDMPCETRYLVHGDALSASIACASVLAKVARDRYMTELDKLYPQYGFAKHKGYGTAEHIAALRKYGPCPVHRLSFLRKIEGIPQ